MPFGVVAVALLQIFHASGLKVGGQTLKKERLFSFAYALLSLMVAVSSR